MQHAARQKLSLSTAYRPIWLVLLSMLLIATPLWVLAQPNGAGTELGSREQISAQLKQAAALYREKRYADAAELYLVLSQAPDEDQAAWALELYGVCLEQQSDHDGAARIYESWLEKYPDSAGEIRVRQRLIALLTASLKPQPARKKVARHKGDHSVRGSASLMYRGMRREVEDQGSETSISSVSGDVDLHLRARSGDWLWRGRVNGGYLSDHSGRGDSDGRVSNLYVGLTHEPTGLALTLGRQRSTDHGIYGYFDGATLTYPATDNIALNLVAGATTTSSRDGVDSDRHVYGLSTDISIPDSAVQLQLYFIEQAYDGLTERRAVGGEIAYFNEFSHYFLVLDYDIKFQEANNIMFNGSWDAAQNTNLALSLGYQRSPFLTASNAIIGEYDVDLGRYVDRLDEDSDIYDVALDKTALSRYASFVVNQRLSDKHRLIGEIYHFELSDLPDFDLFFDAPDSDANTTVGLQYVWSDALFSDDILSMGFRYTAGDVTDSASIFLDEKLRLKHNLNLIMRLRASRRWMDELDQDAYTLRPGLRLDWYIKPDLLLETELGYEWLLQDFSSEEFEVQQGFMLMGVRKRF